MISEAFTSARPSLPTDDDFTYSQRILDAARGVKPSLQTHGIEGVGRVSFGHLFHGESLPTITLGSGTGVNPVGGFATGVSTAREALARINPDNPAKDQVGGTHYKDMAIDVFTFTMANKLDPLQHSVIKYVTRFRAKNGLTDLLKARDCLNRLIAHEYPTHKDTK